MKRFCRTIASAAASPITLPQRTPDRRTLDFRRRRIPTHKVAHPCAVADINATTQLPHAAPFFFDAV
jgi:hypothetical protein